MDIATCHSGTLSVISLMGIENGADNGNIEAASDIIVPGKSTLV